MFKRCVFIGMIAIAGIAIRALVASPSTTDTAPSVIKLPPELPSATGYVARDAFGLKFDQPLCIVSPPGETGRIFVCEKTGQMKVITDLDTTPKEQVFLDVPAMLAAKHQGTLGQAVEWGLLGVAFHPQFAKNGYVYVTYDFTIDESGHKKSFDRLSRFSVSKSDPNQADPDSELPLITQLDRAPNHNGGYLLFGADGYLYYGVGDEGGANDQYNNARFIDKGFFAALYRIDVDKKPGSLEPNPHTQNSTTYPSAVNPGSYAIPADNPFINVTTHGGQTVDPKKVRTEIYACGLRNPWRFSFDQATGRRFIADVGQDHWEEIDLLVPGGDYGWSYFEGTHNGPRLKSLPADMKTIAPIYEYPHTPDSPFAGKCIIGGDVYHGSQLTELNGQYIFGDYNLRRIWTLHLDGDKWVVTPLAMARGGITAFGTDPRNGDILIANYTGGSIDRLERSGTKGPNPPALLSQTGAFSDVAKLTASSELVPYTPTVAFWSDYAIKTRWAYLPKSASRVVFSQDGNWTFPTGMTWVKNFDIETRRGDPTSKRRLETRFLVKTADGCYGITYKWRADQSDADLVPEAGLDETFPVQVDGQSQQQHWHYPSRSECITCHSQVAGSALGFNTRQLNSDLTTAGKTANQLQTLSDAGYFSAPLPPLSSLPKFSRADDQSASLESRVRSYLAVNCVQCHQPGGASQGYWDARPTTSLSDAKLVNGPLLQNSGDPANRWMVPGDAAHSMVLQRLKGEGAPRMPPLATFEIDKGAMSLLDQWIQSMPK